MTRKTKRSVKNKNELPATKKPKGMSKRQQLLQPKTGIWQGVPYESLLELSWIQWCFLLQKEGFIKMFNRSGSYTLTDKVSNSYLDEKGKKRSEVLMRMASYEPDFVIVWNIGWEAFVWDADATTKKNRELVGRKDENGDMVTVIEIKPKMDRNQSIRIAKDRIKFLLAKDGVWVNLVQPELFYEAVFPPPEWLLTPTGLPKKLPYTPKTFFEYLKTI